TDYYTEQANVYWSIQGAPGEPAGHVTVVASKVAVDRSPAITVDNYAGRVTGFGLQFYQGADPQQIAHSGTRPVDLTFAGCITYWPALTTADTGNGANWSFISNTWPW